MRYALLGYDPVGALEELPAKDKRALHSGHRALHDELPSDVTVIAHYRFRPSRLATTVGVRGGELVKEDGPASEVSAGLRALYLVEGDSGAVLDLACRLPAVRMGGTVEVWPLAEVDTEQPTKQRRLHRRREH